MQRLIYLLTILFSAVLSPNAEAANMAARVKYKGGPAYIYRIYLSDKHDTPYSIDRPSRFLSRRSIERRNRQNLPIDSTDLPVSPHYIQLLRQKGATIIGQSRWQNTLLVCADDSLVIREYCQLPCVRACRLVWQAPDSITPTAQRTKYNEQLEEHFYTPKQAYGKTYEQLNILQGLRLHDIGMRGEDMMIAVLDGGFRNVDRIPTFQHIDIRGFRDFVTPSSPTLFAETDHGTKVLSAMAINEPNYYIGSAPKACYWLLRSEDQQTEQEVEEDYWTMAAEFADSVGCDLISSSLGYTEYDHRYMTHHLWQLDGRTAFVSQTASMLFRKGMILINSAGNSGMGTWKKIGVPADADHILTVGAISADEPHPIAPFSSIGPSQDGRVKPDIVAIGAPAYLINGRGAIMQDMGTSFSTPIVCGFVACLWQALPQLSAEELIELVRQTSDNADHPDNIRGYGVPHFWRAYMLGRLKVEQKQRQQAWNNIE
ncbi:MAG: S8 family serine peptidase [Prevotella sp.]|nr:S8 family serine peptidase [Prevotella sp.]